MKHPSLRELYDYWNMRRGHRLAPERADIEPGAIRRVLADTFILSFDPRKGHPFRLAGTRMCAVFGRELKDEAFLALWSPATRPLARDLVKIVGEEGIGAVASAHGPSTTGSTHDLELLLLPLVHRGRTDARILGALVPRGTSRWLGDGTLRKLTLGTVRYLGTETAPVRPTGRIRHGFVVYDGGLA